MKKLIQTFIVGAVALLSPVNSEAQGSLTHEGTDFWIAYPEVYDATAATFEIFISSRYTTSGDVVVWGISTTPYTVVPGVVTTVTIPGIDAHNAIEETVIGRSIHVTSGLPVAVYASTQHSFRSEAAVCLPTSSLGSNYMVTTYDNNLKSGVVYESEFVVVCGPDPVEVEVTPSCVTSEGSPAGVPITVNLDPGDFWLMQAQATDGLDLTGSTVIATNGTDKFAVYNGHRWNYESTGACTNQNADPLLEAAYPTPSWGTEFIAVRTEDQDDNVMRVTTLVDGCDVIVDGTTIGTLASAGDVIEFLMSSPEIYIETTQPANVTQNMETGICATNGDPAMVVLNSNEQMYIDTATFLTPDNGYDANYVTIVTRTADVATVTLDDLPLAGWLTIDYNPEYSYKIEPVAVGSHTVATDGCGFVAYAYGLKNAESYFYAAGVRVNAVDDSLSFTSLSASASGLCDVDTILFTPFTSGGVVDEYSWDFGDGGTSDEANPIHHYTAPGTYTVQLIVTYQCFVDTIVDDIVIYTSPSHTATSADATCYGTDDGSIDITVSGGTPGYTYAWTPGGATSEDLSGLAPGTYSVVVTDDNGCTTEETFTITEPDELISNVNPAGPFAPTDPAYNVTYSAGSTPGGTWSADCGACINSTTGEFDPGVAGEGTWTICYTVGAPPCDVEDCIEILVDADCAYAIYFNEPTCYGFGDGSVTINVSGGSGTITYVITDETGDDVNVGNSNTANSLNEGWYYFQVDDDICSFTDSIFLDDPDIMEVDLDLFHVLCNGDATGYAVVDGILNAQGDLDNITYIWSPAPPESNGVGKDSIGGLTAGTYTLTINDDFGCSVEVPFEIEEPPALEFVELGFDPAYCRLYPYQSGNGVVFAAAGGGVPDYDYLWENVYTLETTTNTTWGGLNPSLYEITVTDANGCVLTQKIWLDSLNPIADFTVTSPQFFDTLEGTACVDAHFVNNSDYFANPNNPFADTTFFWNFNNPNASWVISHDLNETFDTSYCVKGEYEVCLIAQNKNGCTDTTCKVIIVHDKPVLITPNVFTPGKDGINGTFFFPNIAIEEFEAVVVNRWGQVMFEFHSIEDEWNGTNKGGKECPDGVYFYTYKAKSTNGTEFEGQGNVQLLRDKE